MSVTTHQSGDFLTIYGGHPRNARVAVKIGGEGDRSGELLYDTMKPTGDITTPVEVDRVTVFSRPLLRLVGGRCFSDHNLTSLQSAT